jgi:hypothetical protein
MRSAVFSHNGLGDGVNCLVLSNNLHLNHWQVDTYQNTMGSMQNWFPHLPIYPYPSLEDLPRILSTYDWMFVVQNDTDPFVQALIREGKKKNPSRLKVLYLYPSPNIVHEPYYADCLTDPQASIAENMRIVCRRVLKLPRITESNGFTPLPHLVYRKYPKRIVIHPTSARVTRNWPKEKFLSLATQLSSYQLVFVPGQDVGFWEGAQTASFATLDALAQFLYESGFLIGNDSGLGHLASALGIPTLTLCRRKAWAKMWAPSFSPGVVVTPPSWIPNIRGLRLRDTYWKHLISVGAVLRAFRKLEGISCKNLEGRISVSLPHI